MTTKAMPAEADKQHGVRPKGYRLPEATHLGRVRLQVADLARSLSFYEKVLGMRVVRRTSDSVSLGPHGEDREIVHLRQLTGARSVPKRGLLGLYHFAILVPSRADLARALRRFVASGTVLQGAADHGVSEALYLADEDGNGIEIYRDRPREQWPVVAGELRMGAEPMDLDALLSEAGPADSPAGLAPATVIGHVHLHISRLEEAHAFYVGVLGFELMQRYGPSALFVAAGGYHHHVGLNTWAGVGAPPPPPGAIGLRHFVLSLPDGHALAAVVDRLAASGSAPEAFEDGLLVHDPARNAILLTTQG